MTSHSRPTRLIYVDDSGAEVTGYATYSWIEVPLDDWRPALEQILDWRAQLTAEHHIPKNYELHAVNFANGRGNPSLDEAWNRRKAHRLTVLEDAFSRFAQWEWLRAGTVYSKTSLRRDHFGRERARVYGELVALLDQRLSKAGEWGLLVMDGDGSDSSYITAHRSLPIDTRSLIEDPAFQNSSRSQWVQIADLVAYAAYQSIALIPGKEFAWDLYARLNGRADPPQEI